MRQDQRCAALPLDSGQAIVATLAVNLKDAVEALQEMLGMLAEAGCLLLSTAISSETSARLLALIANGAASDPVMLPIELVARRSTARPAAVL